MRIPVFGRRSNPAIDKPIVRKSLAYGEEQVRTGMAAWIDPAEPAKGIIAREMLPSGKVLETVSVAGVSLEGDGYLNLKRVPSPTEWKNPTIQRLCALPRFREVYGQNQLEASLALAPINA